MWIGRHSSPSMLLDRGDDGLLPAGDIAANQLRHIQNFENPQLDALIRKH